MKDINSSISFFSSAERSDSNKFSILKNAMFETVLAISFNMLLPYSLR